MARSKDENHDVEPKRSISFAPSTIFEKLPIGIRLRVSHTHRRGQSMSARYRSCKTHTHTHRLTWYPGEGGGSLKTRGGNGD